MGSNDVLLQEAVVVGKAPEVVVKEDTVEFNADSYKTQPNSVVEDLLKNCRASRWIARENNPCGKGDYQNIGGR